MIRAWIDALLSWLSPYDPPTGEALGWIIVEAQVEKTTRT